MSHDFWTWAIPLALYFAGFWHHAAAWRHGERAAAKAARQQKQFEMFLEVMALVRYGARDEAQELLEEAINLPEDA